MPLSWNEIKDRARRFSREWADEASEDAEAKSFWDAFFDVFGVPRRRVAAFERRRDLIVEGLNAIPGITCRTPKGAFYVFPNITGTGMSSKEFADKLLNEHGVAALSGTAFGEYGEGYLRLSYANSEENLKKALERIAKAAKRD